MATHDWFPEIFGSLDSEATRVTLVTSKGPPTPGGIDTGTLHSLESLPLSAEIYRA